jgi:hypothetical protein
LVGGLELGQRPGKLKVITPPVSLDLSREQMLCNEDDFALERRYIRTASDLEGQHGSLVP